jgi:hypothetical protein
MDSQTAAPLARHNQPNALDSADSALRGMSVYLPLSLRPSMGAGRSRMQH